MMFGGTKSGEARPVSALEAPIMSAYHQGQDAITLRKW